MKSNKRVIIHMGAGKTGSSALQYSFASMYDQLIKNEILYMKDKDFNKAEKGLITSGNAGELVSLLNSPELNKNELEDYVNHLNEKFLSHKIHTILLSSEILQMFKEKNMVFFKQLLDVYHISVSVIYYVRPIVDHAISSYHQKVKRNSYHEDFYYFLKHDYRHTLKSTILKLKKTVGVESIKIINYDSVKEDIFQDFLKRVLLINDNFDINNKKINRSLTEMELSYLRVMNKNFDTNGYSTYISNALVYLNPSKEYQFSLNKKELEYIKEHFSEDIDLFNEFLNKNEEIKIISDEIKIYEKDPIVFDEFQEITISLLSELTKKILK